MKKIIKIKLKVMTNYKLWEAKIKKNVGDCPSVAGPTFIRQLQKGAQRRKPRNNLVLHHPNLYISHDQFIFSLHTSFLR